MQDGEFVGYESQSGHFVFTAALQNKKAFRPGYVQRDPAKRFSISTYLNLHSMQELFPFDLPDGEVYFCG
jgi:hypothetical protein